MTTRVESQLEVRPYRRESDRERLREIYLSSRRVAFHWIDPEVFTPGDFDRETHGESILVAVREDRIVGFSSTWPAERFVHHLYLDPGCRRQGIGGQLLDETLRTFGTPMRLKCLARNTPALRFYLDRGWRVIGRDHGDHGEFCELEFRQRKRKAPDAAAAR